MILLWSRKLRLIKTLRTLVELLEKIDPALVETHTKRGVRRSLKYKLYVHCTKSTNAPMVQVVKPKCKARPASMHTLEDALSSVALEKEEAVASKEIPANCTIQYCVSFPSSLANA